MGRRALWLSGLLGAVAGLGIWAASLLRTHQPTPDWSAEYDVSSHPPEAIAPGTIIGTSPPQGWSHLIIKSHPRVRPDQRAGIMPLAIEKAAWMFTAFTADVTQLEVGGKTSYKFRAIGLGLGSKSKAGEDVVVTPETAEKFGVDMRSPYGPFNINREILSRGYKTQDKAVVVVQSPSFALLDTPVWYRIGEHSKLCRYRYALLIDTASGRLDTLTWLLGPDGTLGDDALVIWLAPNTIDTAELVPDRDEFMPGGIPKFNSDASFAVAGQPKGRAVIPMPEGSHTLAVQTRFTPQEARELEQRLRQMIAN